MIKQRVEESVYEQIQTSIPSEGTDRRVPISASDSNFNAAAEQTGLDPMSPFTAGRLYAAYTQGEEAMDSDTARRAQRHVDLDSNTGMGIIMPLVTDNLQQSVQEEMRGNSESNPYDRIQATFMENGIYDRANEIREIANTPLVARPVQTNGFDDLIGEAGL